MKILVVAAHPDDEVLGCAGTLLNQKNAGDETYCLVLGDGVSARYDSPDSAPEAELKARRVAYNQAAAIVGFKQHWLHDFPDNRFDSVPLLDIVKRIEQTKNEILPDVIYTHFEGDLNVDHRITFQAVLTACRPLPGESVREIYSFEIPSSTEWASPGSNESAFRPNTFVDIAATLEKKIEALKCYDREIAPFPHPRSPQAIEAIAQRWGSTSGLAAAEAFVLVRKIS